MENQGQVTSNGTPNDLSSFDPIQSGQKEIGGKVNGIDLLQGTELPPEQQEPQAESTPMVKTNAATPEKKSETESQEKLFVKVKPTPPKQSAKIERPHTAPSKKQETPKKPADAASGARPKTAPTKSRLPTSPSKTAKKGECVDDFYILANFRCKYMIYALVEWRSNLSPSHKTMRDAPK